MYSPVIANQQNITPNAGKTNCTRSKNQSLQQLKKRLFLKTADVNLATKKGDAMAFNIKGRHFLTLKDFTPQEIRFLIELSATLKKKQICRYSNPVAGGQKYCLNF
jgi:hypothetical protein